MNDNLATIIITLITVLFSAAAFKFYDSRLNKLSQQRKEEREDENSYREDLRARVNNLEQLLIEATKEKNKLISEVISLTRQVAALETKVDFLTKENEFLIRKHEK